MDNQQAAPDETPLATTEEPLMCQSVLDWGSIDDGIPETRCSNPADWQDFHPKDSFRVSLLCDHHAEELSYREKLEDPHSTWKRITPTPISEDQRPSAVEETPEPQPEPPAITYHSDTHRTAPCDRCAEPMEQMRVELLGTWFPFICPACERKADQEQAIAAAKGIQKVRNRTIAEEIPPAYLLLSDALWLATSNSPQKTPGSSAENPFPQHQSQHRRFPTAAWARLRHWYPKGHGDEEPAGEGILRIERGRGLILCGDTGRYKTTIACALLARAHRVLGMSICYLNAAEYGEAVQDKQAWKDDPQLRARSRAKIDTAKRAGLLLIDDLGKEQSTPTIYKQLCHLIEERTSNLRPTIVTTQLPAEDFARILGAQDAYTGRALIRRLQDYCDLIVFS